MSDGAQDWRPAISHERLGARAALLARAREFFAARTVLEVDTPLMVNAAVSDVHIEAACVELAAQPAAAGDAAVSRRLFLHTSPEYAMKRLLAAGSGDIYQICHVVRGMENGRLHNPEFTLIEWYRLGFSLEALMDEVEALVRALLGDAATTRATERLTYCEAFRRETGLDPLSATTADLERVARPLAYSGAAGAPGAAAAGVDRDEWLELLMGAVVGPRLGRGALTFVHRYPASQAALARLDPVDPRVALRFELYCEGIELANGFHELTAASEQRARFARDNEERTRRALPRVEADERLLAALAAGLPQCAGVALGFDRIVMLASGASHIEQVLPFPTARA
ncbi:MAG TPA: EF-P lysine aminoacylase EpmA [Steroidobacteraceae bacterium]|nr:EF-P lysine aminoacylase EpmA [Steroidobacteraceae bacterium]